MAFPRDLLRPEAVDFLADAYRHKGRPVADAILANRHRDYSRAECEAALSRVQIEAETELLILRALRDAGGDFK